LSGITLDIQKGEFVLVKGRSGAGKSTLLNLIGGLISPTSGSVRIEESVINDLDNRAMSYYLTNKIGIIFQGLNLLPTYNIYENIEIALTPTGLGKKDIRKQVMPWFEEFNLTDKIHYYPEELSAGQQQKVAVIRTLVKQPSVILADEPTASVDDLTAREILDHFLSLKNKNNVTVLIATHGVIPDSFADKTIVLEDGRIKY
jgi:putative ABC transport system ATP-binding protein